MAALDSVTFPEAVRQFVANWHSDPVQTQQSHIQDQVYQMMGGDAGYAERLAEQHRERRQYEHIEQHARPIAQRDAERRANVELYDIVTPRERRGVAAAPPTLNQENMRELYDRMVDRAIPVRKPKKVKPPVFAKSFNQRMLERMTFDALTSKP